MALEITGKISQILPLETGESKNGQWKKQFFILDFMDGNYPKKVSISVWGDKTDSLRNLLPGADVKVSFNVESREYNGRWYTDVKAWRIEAAGAGAPANSGAPGNSIPDFAEPTFSGDNNGSDNDLPF
jgi:Domain of unknown function (DUF3127)